MAAMFKPNEFGKYDCPNAECDRKGENGFATGKGLGGHLSRAHGAWANRSKPAKRQYHRHTSTALTPRQPKHLHDVNARTAHTEARSASTATSDLNYCPRCAADLHRIKSELGGATPLVCPTCRLSLAALDLAMNPTMQAADPAQLRAIFATALNLFR
jgi:hypothetical protein